MAYNSANLTSGAGSGSFNLVNIPWDAAPYNNNFTWSYSSNTDTLAIICPSALPWSSYFSGETKLRNGDVIAVTASNGKAWAFVDGSQRTLQIAPINF